MEIRGLSDIDTVLSQQRKWFGAVEAEMIRLQSGEEYSDVVILSLDRLGANYYTMGLFTTDGETHIVHINEISSMKSVQHKAVKELINREYQQSITEERLAYLERLCQVNCGSCSPFYCEEVMRLVDDLGLDAIARKKDDTVIREIEEVQKWIA
jgi:hypothetical protein